ncbi:MAG: uncharacterized membrane protein YtjA (UPF0391 family) [Myxococcota bacterium]|jgi:uncharacterized membrane protein YtjA (UPF0391 family)
MLGWALGFFIVAVIAGILGFGGIAAGVGKVIFFLFLACCIFTLVIRAVKGKPALE